MLWVLKSDVSLEHPIQMLSLMDKKIFTILHSIFHLFIYTYGLFSMSEFVAAA